jgi:hypothetical protein
MRSILAYFQSSTTPLPPPAVASIWVVSYFGLLWDDLLCIDSTFVGWDLVLCDLETFHDQVRVDTS